MLLEKSRDEFLAHPESAYVAGTAWLYFCLDPSLFGFLLWGTPERSDVEALMHVLDGEFIRAPHAALADVSGVETMAPPAFEAIVAFVERRFADLTKVVTRAAIVRPRGFNGALASGFFSAAPAPFETTFVEDVASGLKTLGSKTPLEHAHALEHARAKVEGVSPLLRELRVHLDETCKDNAATIETAAEALKVSVRTLQRALADLNTTYAQELQEARIRRAEHLLLETNEPLTAIAFEIGCASPQHFSALFRKLRGTTPTEFRQRGRARE